MIDLNRESLLTLAEAAKILPPIRDGTRTHVSTIARWIMRGSGGVKLEGARVGSRWITSKEALQRFVERTTAAKLKAPVESTSRAERDARIDRKLSAVGW